MAAVAAEADGEPLFGQVVGQLEPSPLMDERVLRRLCETLGIPAAGSLADQATACRAALLRGTGESEQETLVTVQPGAPTSAPEAEGVVTEQPGANAGTRGSIESLGRWNEKCDDPAMPRKGGGDVRVALGTLVDKLVQNGASSGILAISGQGQFSWSASPDDKSYQRHGAPDEAARLRAEAKKKGKEPLKIRFADFEGVVDDLGGENQIAVYRVTLPSGGLDPDKWVGRPPPPAPEELYTGPRRDGLLSTDEISGEYSAPGCICADGPGYKGCPVIKFCNSMSVVPLGADTIETWRTGCLFVPCYASIGPVAEGEVRTRDPGTNAFDGMTFSADGTASGCYKKRQTSQKRAFQKVETRDLAGKWRGCVCCPFVPFWPLTQFRWTEKTALNQDRYEESGHCCCLALPLPCSVESTTRTRVYVNGHPTNGFYDDGTWYRYDAWVDGMWFVKDGNPDHIQWHRDAGCAGNSCSFAKKVG